MRVASFEPGLAFHGAVLGQIRRKAHQKLLAQIGVGDFAPAKLNHGFDAISFLKEADGVILFEIVVMVVGIGTEFELLYLDDMLFLLGFVLFFLEFVGIVAKIDSFSYRRNGSRSNQNKVEAQFLCFT